MRRASEYINQHPGHPMQGGASAIEVDDLYNDGKITTLSQAGQ